MIPSPLLEEALALLAKSKRPLLISHPRPDGDTIGTTLALRLALKELGASPIVACEHPVPENLAYLPGADSYVQDVPPDADIDLVVAIDMSDLSRAGSVYQERWRGRYPLLVIDHHATNEKFGDVTVVDAHAAATAVLMVEIIAALGATLSSDVATCLLAALLTDTRGLRTSSTTPAVLRLVGELIEAGGAYMRIMQRTMDAVPYLTMRAWGVALSDLELAGNVAWAIMPRAAMRELHLPDHYDLDLGNLLSRVAEANVIAAFVELSDGRVKVSMRSRPGYDVAGLAKEMGGGGHVQASGFTTDGPLSEVVARTLAGLHAEVARVAQANTACDLPPVATP